MRYINPSIWKHLARMESYPYEVPALTNCSASGKGVEGGYATVFVDVTLVVRPISDALAGSKRS